MSKKFNLGHGYDGYLNFIRKYDEAKDLFKTLTVEYQNRNKKDGVFVDTKGFASRSTYLRSLAL